MSPARKCYYEIDYEKLLNACVDAPFVLPAAMVHPSLADMIAYATTTWQWDREDHQIVQRF